LPVLFQKLKNCGSYDSFEEHALRELEVMISSFYISFFIRFPFVFLLTRSAFMASYAYYTAYLASACSIGTYCGTLWPLYNPLDCFKIFKIKLENVILFRYFLTFLRDNMVGEVILMLIVHLYGFHIFCPLCWEFTRNWRELQNRFSDKSQLVW